ncbi:MAG: Hsp20/alpha crystallin family protein [Chloroflexota bacterium]|nr:Hsp20/alpha crystallin family protein [Dehalococcoidia bacterium]MDW8252926.1 Hsp20/alpha crystallin family protein [Chloroflexota bacterium]
MRYRRLSYRYAVVLAIGEPRPIGDPWRTIPVVLAQPRWRPPADLVENDQAFVLTVELAGVESDQVEILLYEDAVIIEGQRRLPVIGSYHVAEIRQGPFRLEMPLPAPVDTEKVEGQLERGLLTMRLPKVTAR